MRIEIRHQKRKSLAFKLSSDGAVVLVPSTLDIESQQVAWTEIAQSLLSH